jgi:hypothetical protein
MKIVEMIYIDKARVERLEHQENLLDLLTTEFPDNQGFRDMAQDYNDFRKILIEELIRRGEWEEK